jgi:hypothetical protein
MIMVKLKNICNVIACSKKKNGNQNDRDQI